MRLLIEILPPGKTEFETLGRFSAEPAELEQLKETLDAHLDPLAAIEALPEGLLRHALEECQKLGYAVRITPEPG